METARKSAQHFTIQLLVLVFFQFILASASLIIPKARVPWIKIKEINQKGPYLGLLTVYPPEEKAFFSTGVFKQNPIYPFVDLSGRRFRVGTVYDKKVIYVACGIGMINAATATQQMLDMFKISGIIHFGISGNLNDSMSIGDVSIPEKFLDSGIWNWINPNATVSSSDVAELKIGKYNIPIVDGSNLLGKIGYSEEQYFSVFDEANVPKQMLWAEVTQRWLHLAASLEEIELEKCVNSSFCLDQKPKLVVGLKGSTSNIFLDNAAYRDFLFSTFGVSTADMESYAVLKTCLSNGFPILVIRGMSDLAGGQVGENPILTFQSLAALNTVKVVLQFIKKLPAADFPSLITSA